MIPSSNDVINFEIINMSQLKSLFTALRIADFPYKFVSLSLNVSFNFFFNLPLHLWAYLKVLHFFFLIFLFKIQQDKSKTFTIKEPQKFYVSFIILTEIL